MVRMDLSPNSPRIQDAILRASKKSPFNMEGPRAELHEANLFVEGKIFYVDGAAALVKGGGNPQHRTSVLYHHVALETHL